MPTISVLAYIDAIEEPSRRAAFEQLRTTLLENLPDGFEEGMQYNMVSFYVPHSIYPAGYHCDTKQPLPFASIASLKSGISLYHMGVYATPELYDWFVAEYPKHAKGKLDMGKSCIKFKNMDNIPFALIGQLMQKMSVQDWVSTYERLYKK